MRNTEENNDINNELIIIYDEYNKIYNKKLEAISILDKSEQYNETEDLKKISKLNLLYILFNTFEFDIINNTTKILTCLDKIEQDNNSLVSKREKNIKILKRIVDTYGLRLKTKHEISRYNYI